MFKSRKIIAIVVAILTVLQVLPVMASDNMLKNSKKFTPAIDVYENVPKTTLTQDEIDKLYTDSKAKVESDLAKQKDKSSILGKENKKSAAYMGIEGFNSFESQEVMSVPSKSTKSSIDTLNSASILSSEVSLSSTTSTTSQTVLEPNDLEAEFLRATASGDRAILKWTPSGNEDGYNVYRIDTQDINHTIVDLGSTDVEKLDATFSGLLPTDSHEYEFFVRAYKLDTNGNEVESADSNHIIVARGTFNINSTKTLQMNHVYESANIDNCTVDLNGKMLKVCYEFTQNNSSIINVNNGRLVALRDYSVNGSSTLKMTNSGDYVYVGGTIYFQTSVIHDGTKLSNGTIQCVGNFKRLSTVGNFKPSGDHRVYLTGLDSSQITTIDFGQDTQSKFNILGINKPLSKYNFIPVGRTMDQWCNKLIYIGCNESYFNFEGVYSPTGNFSRSYTDLEISAPGPDISIGRVYNSKNTKTGILGTGWTFSYEGSIELSSAADVATVNKPDGSSSTFILSGTTSTTKTYSGMDSRDELIYNISSDNYVLTMKDRTKYGFQKVNSQYLLSYVEDYVGNRISVSYLNGKIDQIQDSKGRIVQLEYVVENSYPRVKVKDVSSSRTVVYTLNNSKLDKVTDANGYDVYCFDYTDGFKIMIAEKIENGSTVWKTLDDVKYNANGRIIKHTDMYGKVSEYDYSPNKTTTFSTVNGKVITTVEMYDEANAITERIDDDGTKSVIEYFKNQVLGNVYYNKYNEIKSETDNYGNKTIYDVDSNGNLTTVTNPDKSIKEYGYYTDSVLKDLIKFEKDEENSYTYYEYYSTRLLKKKYVYRTKVTTQPYPELASLNSTNSYITTYEYWPDGQIKSVTEPKYYNSNPVAATTYEYNTNGMLSKITDPEAKTVEYTYNSYKLLQSEKVLLNGYTTYQSTWYDYDKNGKLERKTTCDSDTIATASKKSIERYVYDLSGRLIQKISPNLYDESSDDLANHKYNNTNVGYRYQYYLGTNKVTKETDPVGNVFEYDYDESGNMKTKIEPDLNEFGGTNRTTYRYTYDSRDRIKDVYVTPYGGTEMWLESYEYLTEYVSVDNYKKVVIHKKMLNTMEFITEEIRYDYADRLIEKVSDPGGASEIRISTLYNLDGTTKSIEDGEGYVTYYFYDTMKRPVHIWTPFEGENGVTSSYTYKRYVYDDSGNKVNEAILKTNVDQATFNNETSRNGIHDYAVDDRFYKSSFQYYKNNKLMESVGFTGERKKYYYDGSNNVNKTEEYKDNLDINKITTEYINNYLGKTALEKLYVKTGNIYGNDYNSGTDYIITSTYYYDPEGNMKIRMYPSNARIDLYYYDNLDRLIGETDSSGSYQASSSKVLNWQGNPLSVMNPRGYTTYYSYDWRGLNKKVYLDSQISVYDDTTQTYVQKTYTAMNWYDLAGRKIADVSPNNYVSTMDNIEDPLAAPAYACKNFNFYRYDVVGRLVQSGFRGEEYNYNTSTSTWSASSIYNYKANAYNKNGNLLTSTDEGGYVTEYKYTPEGLIKTKLDPENKLRTLPFTVKYEYDTLGRVTKEKTVKSDTTGLVPVPPSQVIDEASAIGAETTYTYEPQVQSGVIIANKVTKKVNVTDNGGVMETNIYDLKGNLTSHTECKGGTEYQATYEYNNLGKVSKIIEPYIYGTTQSQIQKIMQYDTLGNLVYTQNKMNTEADTTDDICELYSYNAVNLKVKNQCRQRYNGSEAITLSRDYDVNGNVISETDGNTVQTIYQYDRFDRMTTSQITVGGTPHTTVYDYDLNGNLIRTKDWRDNAYVNFYDPMNRVYKKKDPKSVYYEGLEYNSRNLQVKAYDALNKLTKYDYDTNGRLICTTDPYSTGTHKTTLSYDNLGNVKEKTDASSKKLKYTYNILGRLEKVSDGTNDISSYTYYIDGRIRTQLLGTFTTTYKYNCFGELKSVSDPNGEGVSSKTESYEYTPAGLLKEKKDRNGIITYYSYDCHGRLTTQTVTGSDNSSVTITIPLDTGYDQNGNLKKIIVENKGAGGVAESTITTERIYDELNRVKTKKETVVEGGITTIAGPTVYTYDITTGVSSGEIKEKSEYPGSQTIEKVFDKAGRLKLVTNGGEQTVYEYYNDGRRYRVTYKDKFRQTYTYYDDGLLKDLKSEIKNTSGTYVESEYYKYYYNTNHTMQKKDERIGGTTATLKTTSYGYDGLNRLNHIDEPTRIIDYTFDSRGNRATQTETIKSTSKVTYTKYDYTDNNRIQYETKRNTNASGTIIQKKQYQHDNNGNQLKVLDITTTTTTLENNTYTLLNQLKTSWTSASNSTMTNTFNGEGKRVAKKIGTGTPARYFYEGNDVVFEYTNGTGALSVLNVIGLNLISRTLIGTTNGKAYYFYNGHADVTALIDASTNKMRAQYQYDDFGNITLEKYYDSTGTATTDPAKMIKSQARYAGYQYDEESKYYNLDARYYDPKIARFLQQDTYMGEANDPLSLNLYTYCSNDPIMYTDPTGHKEQGTVLKVGSKGEDVVILQKELVELGCLTMPKGVEYGYYGNLTQEAVRQYQIRARITVDGKAGDQTWKALGLYLEGVGDSNTQKGVHDQYSKILQSNQTSGTPIGTTPVISKGTTSTKVTKTTSTSQTVTKSTSTQVIYGYVPPATAVSRGTGKDKVNLGQPTDNSGVIDWIQDKWNQFSEWSDNTTTKSQIDRAKLLLPKGINENTPGYTQMIVDRVIEDDKIQEVSMGIAMGSVGELKIVGGLSEGKGITSLIKNDKRLINAAEEMGTNQVAQKEANELVSKLLEGNVNPGKGTSNLFKDILYLRGAKGSRIFYRNTQEGIEILAKASKANESKVIKILEQLYK